MKAVLRFQDVGMQKYFNWAGMAALAMTPIFLPKTQGSISYL